jgi:hypothetical protein
MLIKTWGFWLFVIPDSIFVVAQFIKPDLKLSSIFYVGIFLLGFLWSNFDIYRQVLRKLPGKGGVPALSISLLEGNEYLFRIKHPIESEAIVKGLVDSTNIFYKFKQPFELIKVIMELENSAYLNKEIYDLINSEIELHLRLENTGCINIDLLDITLLFEDQDNCPFEFSRANVFYLKGNRLGFPVPLNPNKLIVCSLRSNIKPKSQTGAMLATQLADYRKGRRRILKARIIIETRIVSGDKITYKFSKKISLQPLTDLYIVNWLEHERQVLVNIAGGTIENPNL